MTRDDIIRLAREAGFIVAGDPDDLCVIVDDNDCIATNEVMRFAALVAAHEREACAKVCDDLVGDGMRGTPEWNSGVLNCVAAIRERSESERREEFFRKFGND